MTKVQIFAALIASVIFNGFLLFNQPRSKEARIKYGVVQQGLIEKSKSLWKQKEPGKTIEQQGRFAQIIHFSDRTCVSFELRSGGVGGVPVYCFNPYNDKLIQRMDEVE